MRNHCLLFFVLIFTGLNAQDIGISPYSAAGVGDIKFDNNSERFGMGSLSTAMTNPFGANVNFSNPATNLNLRSTNFNFGFSRDFSEQSSNEGSGNRGTSYISNLSIAFPLSDKAKVGLGFQPFSAVGYDFTSITERDGITTANAYKGDGGLNSVHGFFAYNIKPNFSVGVTTKYLFGQISTDERVTTDGADLIADFLYENEAGGFQTTLGAFYSMKLENNKRLELGATFTPRASLNSNVKSLSQTFFLGNNGLPVNVDTLNFVQSDTKTKLPSAFSAAATYTKKLKWGIGLQLDFTNWSSFERPENTFTSGAENRNTFRIGTGGWWIPNVNSYKSYFGRMHYRAGAFYQTEPYVINGAELDRYGITFGLGLPIGKGRNDPSMVNLGLELGRRGTQDFGLIQENYFNFKIGFSLNDTWFRKTLYD